MSLQSLLRFFSGCWLLFFLRRVVDSLQASFFGLIPSETQSFGVQACPGPLSPHRWNFLHSKKLCKVLRSSWVFKWALFASFASCRFLFRSGFLCTAELRCSDPLWSFCRRCDIFLMQSKNDRWKLGLTWVFVMLLAFAFWHWGLGSWNFVFSIF